MIKKEPSTNLSNYEVYYVCTVSLSFVACISTKVWLRVLNIFC